MRVHLVIAVSVLSGLLPVTASSQDARSILETVREKQIERWEGVRSYMVDQSIAGTRTQLYFERVEIDDPELGTYPAFRPASGDEIAQRQSGGTGEVPRLTPDQMELYAEGLEMTGEALGEGIEDGLEEAGLPRGLLAATGSDPWATFDPRVMMGGMALFMRGAAAGERARSDAPSAEDEAMANVHAAADFMAAARLVGEEKVDGRRAFHIRAEGLDRKQTSGGEEFTLESVSMWIDAEAYVPLGFTMEGVASSGGESRPMRIEKRDMDYRSVPDSEMYESYRTVMRIAGVMNAEQEKEMKEAQEKLAEFEKQMEQMPAAQRDMIMRQMGSQMEMMKSMASGGGVEVVTEVHEIRVLERAG